MIHPARAMPFPTLWDGLKKAVEQKLVFEQTRDGEGLSLFCYTRDAVFEKKWDPYVLHIPASSCRKTITATA